MTTEGKEVAQKRAARPIANAKRDFKKYQRVNRRLRLTREQSEPIEQSLQTLSPVFVCKPVDNHPTTPPTH
jgi:hypothetical protein